MRDLVARNYAGASCTIGQQSAAQLPGSTCLPSVEAFEAKLSPDVAGEGES
jgi:hypothetical protein